MRGVTAGIMIILTVLAVAGKTAPHVRVGVVSDWTHNHILFPNSSHASRMARVQRDPRWIQSWYHRHPEAWWPEHPRAHGESSKRYRRDWSVSLSASPTTSSFEPIFDFSFDFITDAGYGSLNTTDAAAYGSTYDGQFLATAGPFTVTVGPDVGSYSLYPGGPAEVGSPSGYFLFDNLLNPSINPGIDNGGLLFTGNGLEINLFSSGTTPPPTYPVTFYDDAGHSSTGGSFPLNAAPGGGQTFPAKYVFDVTAAPSCTNDFVAIGIPTNPASGGQANIVGYNNLYSAGDGSGYCSGTGPAVMFAYASGTGQVPAYVEMSLDGTQLAYIEDLLTGSSYFHVLTIGTTGTNGTSATAAVLPGASGGNNAVDQTVLLSPDSGTTNQSSTNAPFVNYADDVAYVTTYSWAGTGSGYLYKIGNVFNGGVPTIVWSVAITAVPSSPVYDSVSNTVFFTDSNGSIDYVVDTGGSPTVGYGTPVAAGTTSENPIVVDSTNEMIYAMFDSNGTNALVVQAPTTLASTVSVAVGTPSGFYGAPYGVDFNNAWYTGSGTPLMFVAGTDTTGAIPTLYSVGFNGSGVMNSTADPITAALATGTADSSPPSEFYNDEQGTDYLFVGVTNNCIATAGEPGGCVMSLDITGGFPTVGGTATALPAPGGTTGIIVDNDSTLSQASNVYYGTKTGVDLVKATQSGLE